MILVTGATGSNGTELLKLLSARGVPARAMVRSTDKAGAVAKLPGVEIVAGDFDDDASLDRALHGVERAFLLTNSTDRAEARQMSFVAATKRGGVRHILKLSQFAADEASAIYGVIGLVAGSFAAQALASLAGALIRRRNRKEQLAK